jgi:hypothetical protein
MYNSNIPNRAELPSSGKLLRSTAFALLAAVTLLVTTVLPADYGIDPTGIGTRLGLTDMGETKKRLAAEAEADRVATNAADAPATTNVGAPTADIALLAERLVSLEKAVNALVLASQSPTNPTQKASEADAPQLIPEEPQQQAMVVEPQPEPVPEPIADEPQLSETQQQVAVADPEPAPKAVKSDQVSFTLTPGEGVEIKLIMKKNAKTTFEWVSEGGPVNFDIHADGPGQPTISYEKGRGVKADDGVITAAFDGNHGWFWRNRGKSNVKLTLKTEGEYSTMKGVPQQ